jgi:outer membrane protein OmpA-like peptidoglycan-associated protein
MRSVMASLLLAGCLLVIAACAASAADADIEGSKDHPLISRYAGSTIIGYKATTFDEFRLLIPDAPDGSGVLRLEGNITKILYAPPEGRSALEVVRNYEKALRENGFEVLFGCNTRDGTCEGGVYDVRKRMDYQDISGGESHSIREAWFLSAKLARPEGDVYSSIVVWTRKDGSTRARLDIIEMEPMGEAMGQVETAASMSRGIATEGRVAVYGVYFDTDRADIKPESEGTLKEIGALLKESPDLSVYIVGHTDNVGAFDYNVDLSKRRAEAVVKALVSDYGIAPGRLQAAGVGPLVPVSPNTTDEGRAGNRRVEIVQK